MEGPYTVAEAPGYVQAGQVTGSTFIVEILFRTNCSFQGEITWLESKKKRSFRSLLELVLLIQEAQERSGAPSTDYEIRSWFHGEP